MDGQDVFTVMDSTMPFFHSINVVQHIMSYIVHILLDYSLSDGRGLSNMKPTLTMLTRHAYYSVDSQAIS